ncbi:TPR repeat-containing protein [Phytophthora citrophthora]|uniref:TPR repeat-containing protein n=1 Tax=Phytophthora citrophthora TaxID=4793 RepID=A0AAD9GU52_9STRA|nr:TPR repeat-containing protein [Phytophthora citrophthora]
MRSNQQASPTKSHAGGDPTGPSVVEPEAKGQQDLQHAVDLYQKGMEIAHGATTFEDHCRAIESFSLAIAIRPTQARFFLARGNAFRSIGELERAAKDYGSAITLDDRTALYYANRGACYRKLNQSAKALEDLTNAIELDGRKAPHYFNRALVLHDAGFYREAIIDFSKALEDGSTAANAASNSAGASGANAAQTNNGGGIGIRVEYRALQTRANCYRRLGHLPKCIEDLQAAIKLDPRNASAFSALGLAHFECCDFERAADGFTRAIELNASNASYYSYRGLCYYRQGHEVAAKQRLQQDGSATFTSGMGAFARQCLADFNKCIQLDGRDPQAYFYRGSVRLALALDLDQASSTTSTAAAGTIEAKAIESRNTLNSDSTPSAVVAPVPTVSYMSSAEQLEAAFADIEMACTLSPSGAPYQVGMAMIMQLKQRHSEARAMFEAIQSGASDRRSVLVQFHTALCCHTLGDHERALELLTDALDVLPDEPVFLETRGLILQEIRAHPLALADFTHALEVLESHDDHKAKFTQILGLRYLRGESALRLGRYQDAVNDCSMAIAGGYTADMAAHNTRSMAFRGLSDYDRALEDLNACVAQAPNNHIFRFHRALCLMECDRYSEALPDLHETATRNTTDTKYVKKSSQFESLAHLYSLDVSVCKVARQPNECVVFMKRALECKPTQELLPDLYYHIGLSNALEGQNMDAIEHFTSAYNHSLIMEKNIEAGNNQGEEFFDENDKKTQLRQLHEAQLLYIHERAKALQLERYHAEALADFSFVIAQQPTNAHAYFRRGFAQKALGDFKAAAHDLQTARLLDPNNLQLVVNYKELRDVECIVLCAPGKEKRY